MTETTFTSQGSFDTVAFFSLMALPLVTEPSSRIWWPLALVSTPPPNVTIPTAIFTIQQALSRPTAPASARRLWRSNRVGQAVESQFHAGAVQIGRGQYGNSNISDFDTNGNLFPARVTAIGAGKLDAGAAVQTTVEVNPATISFGVIGTRYPRGH